MLWSYLSDVVKSPLDSLHVHLVPLVNGLMKGASKVRSSQLCANNVVE